MFPQQTAIEAMAVGSTGQTELSRENLLNLCLPEIPREIQYRLESVLDQLEEQVERLAQENLTLESLRDALLPELMSGRICVPEAQEAIAEVIPEEDDEHASKTSRG
jgi:putative hsdS-like DNA methylase